MIRPNDGRHLDSGALLQALDAEGDPADLTTSREHLAGCVACRAELERLEQRSARFSGLVGDIELPANFAFPKPPRTTAQVAEPSTLATGWGRERWLRAAAVLLVVLVPLLTVTPLRATVADWLADRWSQVMALARPGAAVIPETSETLAEEPNSVLWFAPNGSELRIELATWQQAGNLVLRSSGSPDASLRILGGSGRENPTVSDQALRIQNTPASIATYEVGVPRGVRRVVLKIGEEEPTVLLGEIPEGRRVFPLVQRPEEP